MLFTLLASFSMFQKFCFMTHLQVTANTFIVSAHTDDHKAIQMHIKQLVKEHLLHYQPAKHS